jgi:hypothetical protein
MKRKRSCQRQFIQHKRGRRGPLQYYSLWSNLNNVRIWDQIRLYGIALLGMTIDDIDDVGHSLPVSCCLCLPRYTLMQMAFLDTLYSDDDKKEENRATHKKETSSSHGKIPS